MVNFLSVCICAPYQCQKCINRDANFSLSQWKRLQIKIDQENQRAGLSELSQGLRLM